jgi:ATP-binding protein involved in chromosome partitioning
VVDPAAPPLVEDTARVAERVEASLAGVGRVVPVMSGKGGVGKSAVAVNLAVALAQRDARVGLLDADLHGPSVAKMLGLRGQPVRVQAAERLRPAAGPSGLVVQSLDFFLQGNEPLAWEGAGGEAAPLRSAMEEAALADLLGFTDWGRLDVLVIDLAPGADRLPALARWLPKSTAALAVTIPTEVALLAVERSLRRAFSAGIAIIGLVENLASTVCSTCGAEGPLYHEVSVERLAEDLAVEVVARIPFDRELARAADSGRPYLEGAGRGSVAGRAFAALAERVVSFDAFGQEANTW